MQNFALDAGDYVPWFHARALSGNPNYAFGSVAGRYVLMLFLGSAGEPTGRAALDLVRGRRALFDDVRACFFGVTVDPADEACGRIAKALPGIRFFLDYDRKVSTRLGAAFADDADGRRYRPHWLLLDPQLRVIESYDIASGSEALDRLWDLAAAPPEAGHAPVLHVPRVFEPALCRELIALHENADAPRAGFMVEVAGKTELKVDTAHKLRRDFTIPDEALRSRLAGHVGRRLAPAVQRAFQFEATRIERYLVACYDETGGYFRPHRDNTTSGTAHRKFAVSINLNASDHEGGDLRFPEFGQRTYRPETGGAIVFSCSLLHEATPVTRGQRYAFLPFLYDEAGAKLRTRNNDRLGASVAAYRLN